MGASVWRFCVLIGVGVSYAIAHITRIISFTKFRVNILNLTTIKRLPFHTKTIIPSNLLLLLFFLFHQCLFLKGNHINQDRTSPTLDNHLIIEWSEYDKIKLMSLLMG